jgi:uncharacterized membrane protein YeaQ/YmgE (transglycosylase-associated protein family)
MRAMKPFFVMISNFEGFEFVAFWLALFIGVIIAGFFLDMLMQRQGFGPFLNGVFALLGAFVGLYLRYNFFMHAPWFGYEPYVTSGLIFGSIAILMLILAFVRNRLWR